MVQRPIVDGALTDVARLQCASTSIFAMQPSLFLNNLNQTVHTIVGEADEGLCQPFEFFVSAGVN